MNLNDVIKTLMDTYNSIDVRTFVFLQDDVWKNVFTIIRFRMETVSQLKTQHEQLINKCGGLIQTNEYRIDLFQFPTERWNKMVDDFEKQFLCLTDDFAINYLNNVHFNNQVTEPSYNQDMTHIHKNWKMFVGYNEASTSSRPQYDDKLFDEALSKRFTSFNDYLSAMMEFEKHHFQHSPRVYVIVPVFFRTDSIEFSHNDAVVKFTTIPRNGLEFTFNFFNASRKSEFVDKIVKPLYVSESNALTSLDAIIPLDTKSLGTEFQLIVTRNNKILLDEIHDKIDSHWKDASDFHHPFGSVFQKYVDFDSLENMLIECESIDLKAPDKVFERGVSWLLNLLGIRNVILGGYEKINGNSVSTDILGNFESSNLILVNVTSGFPREGDFDKEKEYRTNLQKILKNKEIQIKSVYFTAKEPTEFEAAARNNDVLLVGRSKLKVILNHLKKDQVKEARNMLFNLGF
jgi:hypothetical protein